MATSLPRPISASGGRLRSNSPRTRSITRVTPGSWLLFSPKRRGRPGPKGPAPELITAIVEMKHRNPRFGCRRIAQQLSVMFGVEIDKDVVRRVLAKHYRPQPGAHDAAWLTFLGHSISVTRGCVTRNSPRTGGWVKISEVVVDRSLRENGTNSPSDFVYDKRTHPKPTEQEKNAEKACGHDRRRIVIEEVGSIRGRDRERDCHATEKYRDCPPCRLQQESTVKRSPPSAQQSICRACRTCARDAICDQENAHPDRCMTQS